MHELSIARAVVDEVVSSATDHGALGVERIRLRVGRLSGVVAGALQFGFEIASVDTLVAGATLVIEDDPVVVWCPVGEHTLELETLVFFCDEHQCPTPEVLSGKDLMILDYEVAHVEHR